MPDFRTPHHLPNHRPGKEPLNPKEWLPRQRRGTTPQMVGRYPDYDVLESAGAWDEATRQVVLGRLHVAHGLRFFTPHEEPTLRAFCDTATAQDGEPRVPVAEMVDGKLAEGRLDGYQYDGMPDDRDTWRIVLRGLDEVAQRRYGAHGFAGCPQDVREAVVGELSRGELRGGAWDEVDCRRAFSVCMRAVLSAFYSHPWAWNEIGFGGPAYPRGYMRIGEGAVREPHERPAAEDEDPVRIADRLEP